MADRLESQLAELLDLTPAQTDKLPGALADLGLPMEYVDEAKASKDSAAYTDNGPPPFVCAECAHFGSNDCEIVDGDIDPEGSCKWWERDHSEDGTG